jgi:hypothetical protein
VKLAESATVELVAVTVIVADSTVAGVPVGR